jgi:hypothetical protein
MGKDLKETALRIFCAHANRLMPDNDKNRAYNEGLAEQAISYARMFQAACDRMGVDTFNYQKDEDKKDA